VSADPLTTTGQFAQFNDLANRADLEAGLRNLERDLKAWAMLALAVQAAIIVAAMVALKLLA
jgi:hypothetical protein